MKITPGGTNTLGVGNRAGWVAGALVFFATVGFAQVPRPDQPSTRTIQTPERPAKSPTLEERPRSRRTPGGDKQLLPKLEGIVIFKSETELKAEGVPVSPGLHVMGIPLLEGPDFKAVVTPYLGRPLSENALRDLQDDIILYCRARNHPLVDVILQEQQLDNGMLQIWFLEGTVGEVRVSNTLTKWFKDDFIRRQVRVKPGDKVDSAALTKDIEWLNQNPFRSVDVRFQQGKGVGQSDLVLDVQDRIPVRVYVGYEDTGTRFTGEKRFITGLNWGNAFGLDHQFNYQYTADIDFELVSAHSASYFIPLPWRHTFTIFGSYVDAETDFGSNNDVRGKGRSFQISARYGVPLPDIRAYRHEASIGVDFKRADNSLEFVGSGEPVAPSSDADVAQLVVAYTGQLADRWGQTSAGLEGFFSPGDITSHNDDESMDLLRAGADATYAYGRLTVERQTILPLEFSWVVRGVGQLSTGRLLPSEELGAGGYHTVRGYDERVANGDYGFVINNELRTPRLRLGNLLQGTGYASGDFFQALVFFDYANLHYINRDPADQIGSPSADQDRIDLMSVGGGLRYAMSSHLTVRLDYGFPLLNRDVNRRDNGRAHLGIIASF